MHVSAAKMSATGSLAKAPEYMYVLHTRYVHPMASLEDQSVWQAAQILVAPVARCFAKPKPTCFARDLALARGICSTRFCTSGGTVLYCLANWHETKIIYVYKPKYYA
jgi:hypothetical protein